MSKPVRIALIGAGVMGRAHLDLIAKNPDYEVVGIADQTPRIVDMMASKGYRTFTDHRTMLDEVLPDGALIATPNAYHVPAAIDCLERGVAALVEKPVSDSIEGSLSLLNAMKASSATRATPVLVGHHRRHNPLLKRAAKHIADGGLGKIVAVYGTWLRRKPDEYYEDKWKQEAAMGGGVLLINTIHDVDCLRMLCGDVVEVQAMTSSATRGFNVEDTAAVTLRFASGAIGTLTVSDTTVAPWCWEMTSQEDPRFATIPENCYTICGTEGSLAVPTLEHWTNQPNGGRDAPFIRRRLYYVPADALTEQLKHFVDVVRGEQTPLVTAADSTRTLAATLAIRMSAASGTVVRIDDLLAN